MPEMSDDFYMWQLSLDQYSYTFDDSSSSTAAEEKSLNDHTAANSADESNNDSQNNNSNNNSNSNNNNKITYDLDESEREDDIEQINNNSSNNSRKPLSIETSSRRGDSTKGSYHKIYENDNDDDDDDDDYRLYKKQIEAQRNAWKARGFIVLSAALWGSNFGMVKEIVKVVPVDIYTILRFALCSMFTLPTLTCLKGSNPPQGWEFPRRAIESGCYYGLAYVAQGLALRSVPASVSGFLAGTIILLVPFFDLLLNIPVPTKAWTAAYLGLIGIGFMAFGLSGAEVKITETVQLVPQPTKVDMALALLVPVTFSIGAWRAGHAMEIFPQYSSHMTAYQMQSTLFVCILYSVCSGGMADMVAFPWADLFSDFKLCFYIAWTGLMSTLLSNRLFNLALRGLSATEVVGLFAPCEQLFAAAFSLLYIGERINWQIGVGGVFVIAGCLLSTYNGGGGGGST